MNILVATASLSWFQTVPLSNFHSYFFNAAIVIGICTSDFYFATTPLITLASLAALAHFDSAD